ncbi:uncharacterized protein [Amphiura filiformis]|uniref:uncharacterized protein n=1 Tax=Amphiura filiformis TaxID=82378 RepID=UPI003B20FE0A
MATNSESDDTFAENILTCRICRYLFDDKERLPKVLGCMHTICDHCIHELMKNTPYVLCPFCKNTWKIPPNGFPENTVVTSHMCTGDKGTTIVKTKSSQYILCYLQLKILRRISTRHVFKKENDVDEVFMSLEAKLKEQREKAKHEFRQMCESKKQILKDQQDKVNQIYTEYQIASEFAEHLCQLSKPEELLDLQQQVTARLKELMKRDNRDTILQGPFINTNLSFDDDHTRAVEDVQDAISRLGRCNTSTTIPSLCYADHATVPSKRPEGGGLNLINNRQKKLTVHAVSFDRVDGEPQNNEEGGDVFTATLMSPNDSTTECCVDDNGDGTYTVFYTPQVSGQHRLHVNLCRQSIAGSPFQFKSQQMRYQPVVSQQLQSVVIQQQKPCITWKDPPIAGVPHSIDVDVHYDEGDGEPEAKVHAITADICTDEGTPVQYRVSKREGGATLTYTPTKVGNLRVTIKLNDQPIMGPFQIVVTSLENSEISWQQQEAPVVGQRWMLTVDLRNHANEKINLNSDSLGIVIANSTGYSTKLGRARLVTKGVVNSKHEFECICNGPGTQNIDLQVKGVTAKESSFDAADRMFFTMSENKSSFPSSVESSSSGTIYLSDTKLGSVYVRSSENETFPLIPTDTGHASTQITIDEQDLLYLLVPEENRVLVSTNQGRKKLEWMCDERNKNPITIATSRYRQADLVAIGDAAENNNALFLYRKNGTLISSVALPTGCLVDGLDNICIDNDNCVLVCNFSTPEIIKINLDGEQVKTYQTTAHNNQLAITATPEGYVLISEKGRINVYTLTKEGELQEVNVMFTNDHIYTSLTSTANGCVVALDAKLKQLTKYGYLHFK